ncbi:glycoside hydrolase family protein [Paraburkholderia rhizosphaerae]|uniref:Lysozyme n=1 Tax=Paraburkholderia rhizosphaerae TaxID=480658 RepID=A0A4V3HDA4_9BURK|nr:glycoside hydrolase family protein [Paraburkholderia rhizosphaerae]TDY40254.1 lysozyme [Paraburkholderia rhizosphaerae]
MPNETMRTSTAGLSALRAREGAILHYYNDIANNCTFGVGALAHHGPCTEEEMRRPVSTADVNAQLAVSVRSAEAAVRRQVSARELTQDQFDALVSYTFNTGPTGAHPALAAANAGLDEQVVAHMTRNVNVHPRDVHGRRLRAVRSAGLVNRRREEAAPFRIEARAE